MSIKHIQFILWMALSASLCMAGDYAATGPAQTRTMNPIYLMSLGQNLGGAEVLPKGEIRTGLDIGYGSMLELGTNNDGNRLYYDMELLLLQANFSCGLGSGFEARIHIPFIQGTGGSFDSVINDYHDAFNLSGGAREVIKKDEFGYFFEIDDETIYQVEDMDFDIGDVVLGLSRSIIEEQENVPAVSCNVQYKFPTGNRDTGHGSGESDFSIGTAIEKSFSRWHLYLNIDYINVSGHEGFKDLYNDELWAFLSAVEYSVTVKTSLILQVQGSTPMLDGTGVSEWDGSPLDLVLGVQGTRNFKGSDKTVFWQWSFTEDLYPAGPSIDVSTMFSLGFRM